MPRKKIENKNNGAVVPPSVRTTRVSAIARTQALAQAASRWADAAECADAWDARRFAWLSRRAAVLAEAELKKARKDILLDASTIEVMQTHIVCAQDAAEEATLLASLLATKASRPLLQPCVVAQLREAERIALLAWLAYSDNGQPEARLEIADLRAAYERTRQQHRVAAWLCKRIPQPAPVTQVEAIAQAVPA